MSAIFQNLLLAVKNNDVQEHERLVMHLVHLCVSEPVHVLRDIFRAAESETSAKLISTEMYIAREFGHVVETTKI